VVEEGDCECGVCVWGHRVGCCEGGLLDSWTQLGSEGVLTVEGGSERNSPGEKDSYEADGEDSKTEGSGEVDLEVWKVRLCQ
jgi:hypothetical protein